MPNSPIQFRPFQPYNSRAFPAKFMLKQLLAQIIKVMRSISQYKLTEINNQMPRCSLQDLIPERKVEQPIIQKMHSELVN